MQRTPAQSVRCIGRIEDPGYRPAAKGRSLELDPLGRLIDPIDTRHARRTARPGDLAARFTAALRRSELVALDIEDLEFDAARGLKIMIRKSKTPDPDQAGAQVTVPNARARNNGCAVRGVHAWLEVAAIHRGAVFRLMRRGDTPSPRTGSQTNRSR